MKTCPICKRNWEDEFRVCPIDGLALQVIPESDPYRGKSVGQVRVGDKITDGELGPVYRGEDPIRGVVTIQFVPQSRLASPVLFEAFEDAVKLAAKLDHPNVIRVYHLEHAADGSAAVVSEFVDGVSLEDYRRSQPSLDVQQACRIIKEAAEGVLAAHRLSMLHGSLHPSRILVSSNGAVKVGGFHRSGLREDPFSAPATSNALVYLAPERTGIVRDVTIPDYRADIYSLGVIFYELLTGKLPYEAKSLQDLGSAMDVSPAPPSFSNPQVTPTLSRVVVRALSKYPGDRHKSVEEFIRELEAARQPMREPERDIRVGGYESPRPLDRRDDSGLFGPAPRRKESAESLWPEAAHAKQQGDGSIFSWFKTRAGGRSESRGVERSSAGGEDSFFSRKRRPSRDDETEEHTVVVSSRKASGQRRSLIDSFTSTFGDFRDSTGTDALPRRRFSSGVYVLLGVVGVVVIVGVVSLLLIFGRSSTGRLSVESIPSGARVFLNDEPKGETPLSTEVKADIYRIRIQLDGYETKSDMVEVTKEGSHKEYQLIKIEPLAVLKQVQTQEQSTNIIPPPPQGDHPPRSSLDPALNNALRSRNFFPPSAGNAWDVLQEWQQREGSAQSAGLEQARQQFCREVVATGSDLLEKRDANSVRKLLDQIRSHQPSPNCAADLQARYDAQISKSLSDLRINLRAAMDRQSYVTPEVDNALKYVRLILDVDPRDPEAKALESDIYTRALAQARARSDAKDHQEALNILTQLKNNYSNPPGGLEAINQGIERERRKLSLLVTLRQPLSVQVKHGHSLLRLRHRECTGILRVDGFTIEYQSTGEHSFKSSYDLLKSVSYNKGKLLLEGGAIPDGKIELEQAEKNPSPSLAEIYAKIDEYRKLRVEYLRP
ncbi:MAG TPA: serine/threonine-protein kinase [Acidobacteriota bacterium]|nr:serine/threonine-protein kinase [Acidobacteriota bacterium]